jgi:hypothetical protein
VDVYEGVDQAREAMTVRRVYGDPYEKDGVMINPGCQGVVSKTSLAIRNTRECFLELLA